MLPIMGRGMGPGGLGRVSVSEGWRRGDVNWGYLPFSGGGEACAYSPR